MADLFASSVLEAHLRAGAPAREATVLRLRAGAFVLAACLCPATWWVTGNARLVVLAPFFAAIALVDLVLLRALWRGWYHSAVPWVNVLLEISVPAAMQLFVALRLGPVLYLSNGVLIFWAAIIALSTLRVNAALCLAAGVVAASEQMLLSVFLVDPALATLAPALPDLPQLWPTGTPYVPAFTGAIRSTGLLFAGVVAAGVSRHLVQQAQAALRAVREQDLMGKYFLHEKLGAGGMAEVFRATYSPEGGFTKTVALKRVLPTLSADPKFIEMFRDEAKLCSLMAHPNIVQVLDVGRYRGQYILAMEFVDGLPLHRLLQKAGPFPLAAATFVAAELSAALEYLHQRSGPDRKPLHFVHCDLNPPNVLVSSFGEVKLGDFGVARAATRLAGMEEGQLRGKVPYLAPEQLRGEPFDGRADVFAVGLTLYELLAGTRAYPGDDVRVLSRALEAAIEPISSLRPDAPPELAALLGETLARDPKARPTAARLRAALLALPPHCAPLPDGPAVLAAMMQPLSNAPPAVTGSERTTEPARAGTEKLTRSLKSPRQ